MDYSVWTKRLKLFSKQVNLNNGVVRNFNIEDKATEDEIQNLEELIGFTIPKEFRIVLKEYAKSIDFFWYFSENINEKLPKPFKNKVNSGICYWNLNRLAEINKSKNELIEACFIENNIPGAENLLNTLAFLEVPNGDYLVIDMNLSDNPIIYISHEIDEMHGCLLGKNFIDFIENWTLIGCVGAEDWQFEPFISNRNNGIEANSPISAQFREFIDFDPYSLAEADELSIEDLITLESKEKWFDSLLGNNWERFYEIVIEEIESKNQTISIIPAINGGSFDEATIREGVESAGTHKLISFKVEI